MNTYELAKLDILMRKQIIPTAISIIQAESHDLTIRPKPSYDGVKEDFATNGDIKAQAMYMKEIALHFPTFGLIAEEDNVAFAGKGNNGDDIYITVDPLDGTKAYGRGSSQGVGTMIAFVKNREVFAAYVGDVNTGDIYGYSGFGKGEATRVRFGHVSELKPDTTSPLTKQYILLREQPRKFPAVIRKMFDDPKNGGLFKDMEVTSGSVGLTLARLWKGEVGAVVLGSAFSTPWDDTPVLGICRRMGFIFYKFDESKNALVEYEPKLVKEVKERPYNEIMIHETHRKEFEKWLAENQAAGL